MKYLLLALVGLLSLASCARKTYWTGFHGPAYLPSRSAPQALPVPDEAARRAALVRHLDSLTIERWSIPPCQAPARPHFKK